MFFLGAGAGGCSPGAAAETTEAVETSGGIWDSGIAAGSSGGGGPDAGGGGRGALWTSPMRRRVMVSCALVGTPSKIVLQGVSLCHWRQELGDVWGRGLAKFAPPEL